MASDQPTNAAKTGHPVGFWFFFWGEFAERCSFYGMRAILPLYLSDQLGYGDAQGGLFYSLFLGSCYLLPLLGGYIADRFIGKYWSIVGFSIPYIAGQFFIGFSDENRWLLIVSLALLAMGTGVTKPNISTLMGLTYDQQRPGQLALRSAAFSWFYMAVNVGAFLSQAILPTMRDKYGYQAAFLVPAVFMIIALAIFALGKPFYAKEKIDRHKITTAEERQMKLTILKQLGSLFLVVVFFWAVFDQSSLTWVYFARTYMDREVGLIDWDLGLFQIRLRELAPDGIQTLNPFFIVLLTPVMVILWSTLEKKGYKIRPTRKMIVGFLLTASTMGIMAIAAYRCGAKQDSWEITTPEGTIVFAYADLVLANSKEEENQGKKVVQFASANVGLGATVLSISEGKKYEDGLVTFKQGQLKLTNGTLFFTNGKLDFEKSRGLFKEGLIDFQGIYHARFKNGTYALSDKQLTIDTWEVSYKEKPAAADEKKAEDKPAKETFIKLKKADYVPPDQRCSVWWMAIAFFIITVAELLISVTGLELAFTAAPDSMKSFVTGCWLVTVFLANFIVNAPSSYLYPRMSPGNYFLLFTGIGFLVAYIFILVARKFERETANKAI